MPVDELTTHVAAEEYGVSAAELSSQEYKRVYTGLYQCHLGRLDELGVIHFRKDDNTVSLRDVASHLEPYLDEGGNSTPARIELGTASVVTLVVTLGILGVGPFGALSSLPLAALTIAALLGFALFQLFR